MGFNSELKRVKWVLGPILDVNEIASGRGTSGATVNTI
jgi:hypothetical protein